MTVTPLRLTDAAALVHLDLVRPAPEHPVALSPTEVRVSVEGPADAASNTVWECPVGHPTRGQNDPNSQKPRNPGLFAQRSLDVR